jgi:hypothetical protein
MWADSPDATVSEATTIAHDASVCPCVGTTGAFACASTMCRGESTGQMMHATRCAFYLNGRHLFCQLASDLAHCGSC